MEDDMISTTRLFMLGALGAGLAGVLALPPRTPATLQPPVVFDRSMETPEAPDVELARPLTPETLEAFRRMFEEAESERRRQLTRKVEQSKVIGCCAIPSGTDHSLLEVLMSEDVDDAVSVVGIGAVSGANDVGSSEILKALGNLPEEGFGDGVGLGQAPLPTTRQSK